VDAVQELVQVNIVGLPVQHQAETELPPVLEKGSKDISLEERYRLHQIHAQ